MKMIKKIVVALAVVLSLTTSSAMAQNVIGETTICEGRATPLKLDEVAGLALSAGGGYWTEVSAIDNAIIQERVSNVLVAVDLLPGDYKFIFTPTNNPCMDDADRAVVTIHILPIAKAINHYVVLCDGETISLDLKSLLSPALTAMYSGFEFKDSKGVVLTSSTVSFSTKGDFIYTYSITDAGASDCQSSAKIAINVVSQELGDKLDLPTEVAYCINAVPAAINLNTALGFSGKEGVWAATGSAPAPVGGIVSFPTPEIGDYAYTYTYTNCSGTSVTLPFTIKITDDLTSDFVDGSTEVCKTIASNGFIDLMSVLGVNLPETAGSWRVVQEASPVDVADGIFEMAEARVGTYVYRFEVSNAADDLCAIANGAAEVTIKISDSGEVLDGEVQLCKANLSGVTLNMNEFMRSLPSGGTWYDVDGTTVINGDAFDVSGLNLGVYSYTYKFDGGTCGEGEASLLVVVTDMLTNFKDKTVKFCLTDDGADAIDLDQLLAIGGISGVWTATADSNATTQNPTLDANNVFNGRDAGVGIYYFEFKSSEDACGIQIDDTSMITVIITEDLTE